MAMLLFIPFLRLLFGQTELTLERPDFELSAEYLEQAFNYFMSSYIQEFGGPTGALFFICVTIGILFLLKNLTRYLAMFFLAGIRNGVVRDIRQSLYSKILALPLAYYSEEKKGDLIARVTGDVQEVEVSIMSSLELIFREPVAIALYLITMITISPQLTLISFVLLPIGALVIGRIGKSLKRTSAKGQNKMGELLSNIEETLSGLRVIKAFNGEESAQQKFDTLNNRYRTLMTRLYRKRDLASPLSEFLGSVVMVALVWFGGKLILDTDNESPPLSGDEFIGFVIVFSQLLRPIQAISTAYSNINKGIASVERIDAVLMADVTIQEKENATALTAFEQHIQYHNVGFTYDTEPVLKNINLTIEKGKTIALVGESGGGKSTLADLLPRFYDCVEGEITIDGVAIKDCKIKDLRGLMGVVTQQSILFNDTIFNNIAFGLKDISQEAVETAAQIANAHEFITEFEQGYNTNIGDGGNKLSGGQRQRISIARAVLKNPPILILDEATSALDTESERLVQDALYKLMQNRTSLVIAHRLSTIQHADEIIVLKKGEIAERGTHQELLAQQGVYKKLYDLQSFA